MLEENDTKRFEKIETKECNKINTSDIETKDREARERDTSETSETRDSETIEKETRDSSKTSYSENRDISKDSEKEIRRERGYTKKTLTLDILFVAKVKTNLYCEAIRQGVF